ncbi:uncharacterized protein BO72DRAFT_450319 [Aspergillus fijiensis CBS 313.89]|uniref:Uncharacterized protein n=1 Tax=Aspergillus fijiensis CBS 313.89 TaxID=1448319 RepID=A0A8G1RNW9_9EURO|nr:uncharacterized protein BO72DRAFT_450319 [Aspergillus fijiensis CBS 313.89]RAK74861.1 hypothetical protein BO72DRAFT_450319 [Aspergillus fijiensis CBS 313.89]
MRWTPEADQLLLLKIVETHNLSVNYRKVAEAWPVAAGELPPTPRAISERLVRIRNLAGTTASGTSKGSNQDDNNPITPTATPRKPRKNSAPATPSSTKRKRETAIKAESMPADSLIKSEAGAAPSPIKIEALNPFGIDTHMMDTTPTKKTPLAHTGMGAANQLFAGHTLYQTHGAAAAAHVEQDTPSKRVRKPAAPAPGMVNWTTHHHFGRDEQEVDVESSASEYCPENEMVAAPRGAMMNYI